MTLPRQLTLHQNKDGSYRLRSLPVRQLNRLKEHQQMILDPQTFSGKQLISNSKKNHLSTIRLSFDKPKKGDVGLRLSNKKGEYVDILYQSKNQQYAIDRRQSGAVDFSEDFPGIHIGPVDYEMNTVEMLLFVDHASVELFADGGKLSMTEIVFPSQPYSKIELISTEGAAKLKQGSITALKNIWRK